jgi:hypothetical protein
LGLFPGLGMADLKTMSNQFLAGKVFSPSFYLHNILVHSFDFENKPFQLEFIFSDFFEAILPLTIFI